jgi:hypothetical protein
VAGDGELIEEDAAIEEVLMPEVTAVSSSLERVLYVVTEMTVLPGGSDKNRGGECGVEELSPCTHMWDKDDRSTWDGGYRRCTVTAVSPRMVSHRCTL